ncbi:MAG: ABC transporter permease [Gammaproteobacteria bacterium]|nr:ABC transporter permease [Gammaproteobacteria bacterium]
MEPYILLLASTLTAGTVLALAGLGLLIHEKAGVLNLGTEGMMLCAALAAFATVVHTQSLLMGFLAGMLTGCLLGGFFGFLVIWLNTNSYATGLALSLFGMGFSAFAGRSYVQAKFPIANQNYDIPYLSDIPVLGDLLFKQHPLVYLSVVLAIFITWFFQKSRAGLVVRSIGESPESAHALGYPVRKIRLMTVLAGGALVGLAGAFLSTAYTTLWVENMVAGRGWIALALTTFATWRSLRILLGAYLFGGVTMLQFHLQGMGVQIPSHFLSMMPYLATILVLIVISRNPDWIKLNIPASIGKPFYPNS